MLDYRAVDPRLGTMADLSALADALRERGMSLCVDLVLNHTAKEHAVGARLAGRRPGIRGLLLGVPGPGDARRVRTDHRPGLPGPRARLVHLVRGFGDAALGLDHLLDYQWDLDYTNPAVFAAMLETILWLANRGIDIFRLDAVPFMWKRLGTTCMNQPEVHRIVQAMHALTRLAAPGVIFKAEAIVAPDDLVPYLGGHDRYRPECELAYHNQLMVMLWSSLATKDARLMAQSLRRMKPSRPRRPG